MKRFTFFFAITISATINAQSLSPSVIASSGGFFANSDASLSWTLGEPITATFADGNNILTQGFQQPQVNLILVNVNAYIEGFYISSGNMQTTLFNLGITSDPTATDTIRIDLWNSLHLANLLPDFTVATILHKNGTASATINGFTPGSYYIAIRHRNSIETWSAAPVAMNTSSVTYDFRSSLSSAYGSNMKQIDAGKYGIYSGDVNQDDIVESADYSDMENAVVVTATGYQPTDITGDAIVESSDYSLMENNVVFTRALIRP